MKTSLVLLTLSFLLTSNLFAQNLLTNGDFETGNLNGWKVNNSAVIASDLTEGGQYCVQVRKPDQKGGWVFQEHNLVPGKTYRYSGYLKIAEIGKEYFFSVKCRNSYYVSYTLINNDNKYTEWTYFSKTFKVKENSVHKVAVYVPKKGTIYADNIVLEEIDPTGMSSEALILSSKYGVVEGNTIKDIPPIDVPFSKFLEGLQISEKARIELMTSSELAVTNLSLATTEGSKVKVFAEDGSYQIYTLNFNENVLLGTNVGELNNKNHTIANVPPVLTAAQFTENLQKSPLATIQIEYTENNSLVSDNEIITSAMQVRVSSDKDDDKVYSISVREIYKGSELLYVPNGSINQESTSVVDVPDKTMAFYIKELATVSPGASIIIVDTGENEVPDNAIITNNMKIVVTSEEGKSTSYSIATTEKDMAYGFYANNKTLEMESLSDNAISLNGKAKLHINGSGNPLKGSRVSLNGPDAWVYFHNIRPSAVADSLLSGIYVDGHPAVYTYLTKNIRIKQYARGTVIIPHTDDYEALTLFDKENYEGTTKKLKPYIFYRSNELGSFADNVGSFRLKHGYMATFAENEDGTGFSKVFIASENDVDVSLMEPGLKDKVSFVRVFPWNWPSKKGFCGSLLYAEKMDATWHYNWGMSSERSIDVEFVPEKWGGGYADEYGHFRDITHILAFNEPSHKEQSNLTVAQAIEYWPSLMKSGLRLSSPAIADNGKPWLWEFWDEIEKHNYRVDYVVCHWYKGGRTAMQYYNWIKEIHDRTGRPIWIKEWNNGANWTNEPGPHTYAEQAKDIEKFLHMLDTTSWVERHSLYEWVGEWRQMINDYNTFELNPAGVIYKENKAPVFYNPEKAYDHRDTPTKKPLLNFVNPENGSSLENLNGFKVKVDASDPDGSISSVQLYLNNVFVGLDMVSPYQWGIDNTHLNPLLKGDYTLRAVATDNSGARSEKSIMFNVSKDLVSSTPSLKTKEKDIAFIYSFNNEAIINLLSRKATVKVYDINGRMVNNQLIIEGENRIQMSTSGVYIISIINEDGATQTKKIKI